MSGVLSRSLAMETRSPSAGRLSMLLFALLLIAVGSNAQALEFTAETYQVQVHETGTSVPDGKSYDRPPIGFLTVECTPSSSVMTYSIYSPDPGPFDLNSDTGELSVTADLDYETATSYSFTVSCTDGNNTSSAIVEIVVLSVNEFSPEVIIHLNQASSTVLVFYDGDFNVGDAILGTSNADPTIPYITATDEDSGPDGVLTFQLSSQDEWLNVNGSTGQVVWGVLPDLDVLMNQTFSLSFTVDACDPYQCVSPSSQIVAIILGNNEHFPMFSQLEYHETFPENTMQGTLVVVATCTDGDYGTLDEFGAFDHIQFSNPTDSIITSHFYVDEDTGKVFLLKDLDYESNQNFGFVLDCYDKVDNVNSTTVIVTVTPLNDNQPQFVMTLFLFDVSRTTPPTNYPVGKAEAVDADLSVGSDLTYSIEVNNHFSIDNTGTIHLFHSVQNISNSSIVLKVTVTDGTFEDEAVVLLNITDGNYEAPVFVTPIYILLDVSELVALGTPLTYVKCNDSETGLNGLISYSISSGNIGKAFSIDSNSGQISVASPLILGGNMTSIIYSLIVKCSDSGVPTYSDSSAVIITVFKDDTPPPDIANNTIVAFINEDAPLNTVVVNVTAVNFDSTDQLTFFLEDLSTPGAFFIVPISGTVLLGTPLDREKGDTVFTMTVIVKAMSLHGLTQSDNATLIVYVRDVNDNPPSCNIISVVNVLETVPADSIIANFNCTDPDFGDNANLTFLIEDDFFVFSADGNGNLIVDSPLTEVNQTAFNLMVTASDGGTPQLNTTFTVSVFITATNDFKPSFVNFPTALSISEAQPLNSLVHQFQATDEDQGSFGQLSFALVNQSSLPFTLVPNTGELYLVEKLDFFVQSQYYLRISVSDPDFTTNQDLIAYVNDFNEYLPFCTNYFVTQAVSEGLPSFDVTLPSCSDSDKGSNGDLVYEIVGGNEDGTFTASGGQLITNQTLDFETTQQYDLLVRVSDSGEPPLFTDISVIINVQPVNEFTPVLDNTSYAVSILEGVSIGEVILSVFATDEDAGADGSVLYSLIPLQNDFGIDNDGALLVTGTVDREDTSSYSFTIRATDKGAIPQFDDASVAITVLDVDDSIPEFSNILYTTIIEAGMTDAGNQVIAVECIDDDVGSNAEVIYQLLPSGDASYFAVSSSGVVSIIEDLRISGTYSFGVQCLGVLNPLFNDSAQVIVTVEVSSNIVFVGANNNTYTVTLSETNPLIQFLTINATSTADSTLSYDLIQSPSIFVIDSGTGQISLVGNLDYETVKAYALVVEASDGGSPPNKGQAVVHIFVENENDEAPHFLSAAGSYTLVDGNSYNTLGQYECSDEDEDIFGEVSFDILSGNVGDLFAIDSVSGVLQVVGVVDYELAMSFSLVLQCSDGGNPPLSDTLIIPISVTPVNEHPPMFSSPSVTLNINEAIPLSTVLTISQTELEATDADQSPHNQIWYTILSGNEGQNFVISSTQGYLTVVKTLDYEIVQSYTLVVMADDSGGVSNPGYTVLNSTITVLIQVIDANDNKPQFDSAVYSGSLPENAVVGYLVEGITITCTDADSGSNGDTVLSIVGGNDDDAFTLTLNQAKIEVQNTLDFESVPYYVLTIRCADQGNPMLLSEVSATISITDISEFGPIFNQSLYEFFVKETTIPSTVVGTVFAIDQDGGITGQVTYTISDSIPFTINEFGAISVKTPLDFETQDKTYTANVTATDSIGLSDTVLVVFIIENVDEFVPVLSQSNYYGTIIETKDAPITVNFGSAISCSDADDAAEGLDTTYSLSNTNSTGSGSFPLIIDEVSGVIQSNAVLDLETKARYTFSVVCTDSNGNAMSSAVTVDVQPFNDFAPLFLGTPYTVTISENPPLYTPIFEVTAIDTDDASFNDITFGISAGNEASLFTIDQISGAVTPINNIDYETQSQITLTLSATNIIPIGDTTGSPTLSSTTSLVIFVTDINDNKPVITPPGGTKVITTDDGPGTLVASFTCTDGDSGQNANTTLSLTGSNAEKFFLYGNGTVVTAQTILNDLVLQIKCSDMGFPSLSSTVIVNIVSAITFMPEFPDKFKPFEVPENFTVGEVVECVEATDDDGSAIPDGFLLYTLELISENVTDRFDVHSDSGCVFLAAALDYDDEQEYLYLMRASVGDFFDEITLIITVKNVEFNAPQFTTDSFSRVMSEGTQVDTIVTDTVTCTDQDDEDLITYSIEVGNSNEQFFINDTTGELRLENSLDYESAVEHTLTVRCTDSSELYDEITVFVTVSPINEFVPVLTSKNYFLKEQSVIGTTIAILEYSDNDAGPDGDILEFTILTEGLENVFSITPLGKLILYEILDREEQDFYSMTVRLSDNAVNPDNRLTSTATINVTLTDINDNKPLPLEDVYVFGPINATEAVEGTSVGVVMCNDSDIGLNSLISYTISSQDFFLISSSNGTITINGNLQEREMDNIAMEVTCSDQGVPSLQTTFPVIVQVYEFNKYPPYFLQSAYSLSVPENQTTFTTFASVMAIDNDTGINGRIEYRLVDDFDNRFFIDADTGELSLLLALDYESQSSYMLEVLAIDGAPDGNMKKTANVNVSITVTGVNEHTPLCTQPIYTTIINQLDIGFVVQLNCTDLDTGLDGQLVYDISEGKHSSLFMVSNAGQLSIVSNILPNESIEVYDIMVTVSDQGNPSKQTEVEVDFVYSFVNAESPKFANESYVFVVPESMPVGTVIYKIHAVDNDPGIQGQVSYTVKGTDYFQINPETGELFITQALDAESFDDSIDFEVVASDSDPVSPKSDTAIVNVTVTDVNDNAPTCMQVFYIVTIGSGLSTGDSVFNLEEECFDLDVESSLSYQLQGSDVFAINQIGLITVKGDLTPGTSLALLVSVSDGTLSTTVSLSVQVMFNNLQPPMFSQASYSFNIAEDASLLANVGQVSAFDADSPSNDLSYSISSTTHSGQFYVDPLSGEIILTSLLDYEMSTQYTFEIKVEDAGSFNGLNVLSNEASVTVSVMNVNDNLPELSDGGVYGTTVSKTSAVGSTVLTINCTDDDLPPYGNPAISSHDFTADVPFSLVGSGSYWEVRVQQDLRELNGSISYFFNVTCSDEGGEESHGQVFLFVPEVNAPVFTKALYEWSIPEDSEPGLQFEDLQAISQDGSEVTYEIVEGNTNGLFYIHPGTGIVSLSGELDYETQNIHGLVVTATDSQSRKSSVLLLVEVLDVNDQVPLTPPSAILQVEQHRMPGYPVGVLQCSEPEETDSEAQFNFTITPPSELFSVDSNGLVRLEANLDATPVYVLPVICYNLETPQFVSTGIVTIQVLFSNIYSAEFDLTTYTVFVPEDRAVESLVTTVQATDDDVGSYGEVTYSITAGNPNKFFIHAKLGQIGILTMLDREEQNMYNLTIEAVDGGSSTNDTSRKTGTASVIVHVTDVNDNVPSLGQPSYFASILTNHSILSPVLQLTCSDPDLAENGTVEFSITPPHQYFIIDSNGTLILSQKQQSQAVHNLNIYCQDHASTPLSSSSLVTVVVNKVEFGAPVFDQSTYNASVSENAPIFSSILQVQASVPDTDVSIVYSLTSGNTGNKFYVDPLNGELVLVNTLDYNQQAFFVLTVGASTTGFVTYSVQSTISISVIDENDHVPFFIPIPFYTATIPEAVAFFSPLVQVTCTDLDPTDTLVLTIVDSTPSTSAFTMTQDGWLVATEQLDYETSTFYVLTVECSDGGSPPMEATISVGVEPVNEYAPVFLQKKYKFSVYENAELGMVLGSVGATDSDQGIDGTISYLLQNPGGFLPIFVDPSNGTVTVSNIIDYESVSFFNLSVIAQDGSGLETYVPIEIEVINQNDVPPSLNPGSSVYEGRVITDSPADFFIEAFTCVDEDGGETYISIVNGSGLGYFHLNAFNHLVWSGISLDITSDQVVLLFLQCVDEGNQTDFATIAIVIGIPDSTTPSFTSFTYSASVPENATLGTHVLTVSASNGKHIIQYSILNLLPDLPFEITGSTGEIHTSSQLSREVTEFYSFPVQAVDTNLSTVAVALVEIIVTDINDNSPLITPSFYLVSLSEDSPVGIAYVKFSCTDKDENENGMTFFSIIYGDPYDNFLINGNGNVHLEKPLDYENTTEYNIIIACLDNGSPQLSSTANLVVQVTGINEYSPMFSMPLYNFNISEMTKLGSFIGFVNATDQDDGDNGIFDFSLVGGDGKNFFSLQEVSGEILVKTGLNASQYSSLDIIVAATDSGPPTSLQSTALVEISIGDENEKPFFDQPSYFTLTNINQEPGQDILELTCFDYDLGQNSELSLTLSADGGLEGAVYLNMTTSLAGGSLIGTLRLNSSLSVGTYELNVSCFDSGLPPLAAYAIVTIIVQPNNTAPKFTQPIYGVSIDENTELDIPLLTVKASDKESNVTYSIFGGTGLDKFSVGQTSGVVTLVSPLNFEAVSSYLFTVIAVDDDVFEMLTGTAVVTVEVQNVNDLPPVIAPLSTTTTLPESTAVGTSLLDFTCSDGDGSDVSFSIQPPSGPNSPFAISPKSGDVTVSHELDYEQSPSYSLTVTCSDEIVAGGDVPKSSAAFLVIIVNPVNIHSPEFISPSSFNISETAGPGTLVGTIVAIDQDQRGTITYFTSSFTDLFSVNPASGEIRLLGTLDRETTESYELLIVANDNDAELGLVTPKSSTAIVNIAVTDINDNPPSCNITFEVVTIVAGTYNNTLSLFNASCTDKDLGLNGELSYTLISSPSEGMFSVNSDTGELSFMGNITMDSNLFVIRIQVADLGTEQVTNPVIIQVSLTVYSGNEPRFNPNYFSATIPEDLPAQELVINGSVFTSALINVPDGESIAFFISSNLSVFLVDQNTGNIFLLDESSLDFDQGPQSYSFFLQAMVGDFDAEAVVEIFLTDSNDNAPIFGQSVYDGNVLENQASGTLLNNVSISTTDEDSGSNSMVQYFITGDNSAVFDIDPITGVISTLKILDRETIETYPITVLAIDQGVPPQTSTTFVIVTVNDENDNPPSFVLSDYVITITDISKQGTVLAMFEATDPDILGSIKYSIVYTSDQAFLSALFDFDASNGVLTQKTNIPTDFEPQYSFSVEANDELVSVSTQVTLYIIKVSQTYWSIWENQNSSFNLDPLILTFNISDNVTYEIVSGNDLGHFTIVGEEIQTAVFPDRENISLYEITISVIGTNDQQINLIMEITIQDRNDNPPIFEQAFYQFNITEGNFEVETVFGEVLAIDNDDPATPNARVEYEIVAKPQTPVLSIDLMEGYLIVFGIVDRESQAAFNITIKASDYGAPQPMSSSAEVEIIINDINDNSPQFVPNDIMEYHVYFHLYDTPGTLQDSIVAVRTGGHAAHVDAFTFTDPDLDQVSASINTDLFALTSTTSPANLVTLTSINRTMDLTSFSISIHDMGETIPTVPVIIHVLSLTAPTETHEPSGSFTMTRPEVTPSPSSRGNEDFTDMPLGIAIIVVACVLFVAVFLFVFCVICVCYKRYQLEKDSNKRRPTSVFKRVENPHRQRRASKDSLQRYNYTEIDRLDLLGYPETVPHDPDDNYMYGEYNQYETAFTNPAAMAMYEEQSDYPYDPYYDHEDTNPLTSTSRITVSDEESDVQPSDSQKATYGHILEEMLQQFRLGDELIRKENKKGWGSKLSPTKS